MYKYKECVVAQTQKQNKMKFYDERLNVHFEILEDFMNNVIMPDGKVQHISSALPDVKTVNHTSGYIVMKDGTIRCSLGCSNSVATYDGCKEIEILQMWGN